MCVCVCVCVCVVCVCVCVCVCVNEFIYMYIYVYNNIRVSQGDQQYTVCDEFCRNLAGLKSHVRAHKPKKNW